MIPDEAVQAAAKVATEQLAMYTFPANFNGGQAYYEEVAERCGPLIARAAIEAALPYLSEAARQPQRNSPTDWPDLPKANR